MNMYVEALGYLGAVCLLVCNVPQILKIYRRKSVGDISLLMIVMLHLGAISMCLYVVLTTQALPLIITYSITSIISLAMLMLYFKYR